MVSSEARAPIRPATALHAAGPPPGHTGGFGEPTCHECHLEFDLNLDGRLTVEGLPEAYRAGESYLVTVALRSTEMARAGFQAAARFQSPTKAGAQAGVLAPLNGETCVAVDTLIGVQYVQHSLEAVEVADPGFVSWSFEWRAPEGGGSVSFHASANSANGDDSPLGDLVYTTSVSLSAEIGQPGAPARSHEPEMGPSDRFRCGETP